MRHYVNTLDGTLKHFFCFILSKKKENDKQRYF